MKTIILRLFIVLLAIMFLSTPVMAKSNKSDKKPWYSYFVLKAKIKSLERKLRSKIKEIRKLEYKNRKLAQQKQGPPGPQGPAGPMGPMGPKGPEGKIPDLEGRIADLEDMIADLGGSTGGTYTGDTPRLICPGCWFPGDKPPNEVLARLEGAYLPHASMTGIDLSDAVLIGADLRGATIKWADLSGADLTDVDFRAMPWRGFFDGRENVFNTDLTGTNMTGATLDGIKWGNTICPDGTNSDNTSGGICEGDHLIPQPVP
jgi:hypothetical protein